MNPFWTATRQQATEEYQKAMKVLKEIGLGQEFRKRVEAYASTQKNSKYNTNEAVLYGNIAAYIRSEKQDMMNALGL